MGKAALEGEHYCKDHQGNHSHYAKHNCTVCKQAEEITRLRAKLAEVEGQEEKLVEIIRRSYLLGVDDAVEGQAAWCRQGSEEKATELLQEMRTDADLFAHPAPAKVSEDHAPYGYCPICGKPGVQRERRLAGDDFCVSGHKYPSAESLTRLRAKLAEVPDESELVHIGYTNGAQVLYCVANKSGSFYPDTENDSCIPVYMLRTHAHRLESTTNGVVTLDLIKHAWKMLKSQGGGVKE